MSEPTGPGMGRPSGPGYAGPSLPGPAPASPPLGQPGQRGPAGSSGRSPLAPPPNRLPAVLTVVAVVVVGAIVVIGSVLAARQDVRDANPRPAVATPAASASPAPTDRIEFTTATGTGVLELVDHTWDSAGSDAHAGGPLLTVTVRVSCESGTVDYGPDSFQAFDRHGDLFDPEVLPDTGTALELGTLSAGQQVEGTVTFDIPRGGVTLLMSDDGSQTVTALKVPD